MAFPQSPSPHRDDLRPDKRQQAHLKTVVFAEEPLQLGAHRLHNTIRPLASQGNGKIHQYGNATHESKL